VCPDVDLDNVFLLVIGIDQILKLFVVCSFSQGQNCFICKKGGHMAKDCPDKHKKNNQQSTLCLRCGETGHDMLGCFNDSPPDDIQVSFCLPCFSQICYLTAISGCCLLVGLPDSAQKHCFPLVFFLK
jgi:hypothetical protein